MTAEIGDLDNEKAKGCKIFLIENIFIFNSFINQYFGLLASLKYSLKRGFLRVFFLSVDVLVSFQR